MNQHRTAIFFYIPLGWERLLGGFLPLFRISEGFFRKVGAGRKENEGASFKRDAGRCVPVAGANSRS